jgi:hypothetical protein
MGGSVKALLARCKSGPEIGYLSRSAWENDASVTRCAEDNRPLVAGCSTVQQVKLNDSIREQEWVGYPALEVEQQAVHDTETT